MFLELPFLCFIRANICISKSNKPFHVKRIQMASSFSMVDLSIYTKVVAKLLDRLNVYKASGLGGLNAVVERV